MIQQLICALLFATIYISSSVQAQVGNRCTVESNGKAGVCKVGRDCDIAQEQAKLGIRPTLCGFLYNTIPLVCCEGATLSDIGPIPGTVAPEIADDDTTITFPSSPLPLWKKKCKEYSRITQQRISVKPLSADAPSSSIIINKCNSQSIPLIVGGESAKPGEFPFMAAIGYKGDGEILWNCGGTLISDRYVLTAAHCANTLSYGPPVKIRLGDLDLKDGDDGAHPQEVNVEEIKVHPDYTPVTKHNDIALIKLSRKVDINDNFTRPACLWHEDDIGGDTATATGWGATEDGGDTSSRLRKVRLSVFANSICDRTYRNKYFPSGLPKTMMCAGELAGGKDTCQGDSGGPLTITDKKNYCLFHVVGITSFGKVCAAENTPAVYTRVSEFVPWIENNVWK